MYFCGYLLLLIDCIRNITYIVFEHPFGVTSFTVTLYYEHY